MGTILSGGKNKVGRLTIPPGMTHPPLASMNLATWASWKAPRSLIAAMVSPVIATSTSRISSAVTTIPFVMTRSYASLAMLRMIGYLGMQSGRICVGVDAATKRYSCYNHMDAGCW